MKTFVTNTSIYRIEKREDGELDMYREYSRKSRHGQWVKDGSKYADVGMFVNQRGGKDNFLSMCVDYDDLEGFVAKQNKENKEFSNIHKAIAEENAKKQEEEYALAFADEVTECNKENIYLLLRHLNKINWGAWSLPKMSIGYSCNQYNCNGVTATTIILDKPIEYGDEMIDKFVYGAPHGHLSDYVQIRYWR